MFFICFNKIKSDTLLGAIKKKILFYDYFIFFLFFFSFFINQPNSILKKIHNMTTFIIGKHFQGDRNSTLKRSMIFNISTKIH